ncbi:hypothetical protein RHECNPAF_1330088 [Rhizobium etli CNPAF512]|nr:hypothetical protein RHECNPAF_1330088 [Rhizobium etli CNPAF512]
MRTPPISKTTDDGPTDVLLACLCVNMLDRSGSQEKHARNRMRSGEGASRRVFRVVTVKKTAAVERTSTAAKSALKGPRKAWGGVAKAMRENPMEYSSDRDQGFQSSFTSQAALPQFRKPMPQWSLSRAKCFIVRQFIFQASSRR